MANQFKLNKGETVANKFTLSENEAKWLFYICDSEHIRFEIDWSKTCCQRTGLYKIEDEQPRIDKGPGGNRAIAFEI